MTELHASTKNALEHIRYLSETIGGRGSCTPQEQQAAEYCANQMAEMGVQDIRVETFPSMASTYRPFALAFAAGLAGTLVAWLIGSRGGLAFGALLNGLGAWGMLAETDLAANWTRWLLPQCQSRNAVGIIRPSGEIENRAVVCAHIDTHRTPVFYSSPGWQALFTILVGGALLSMVVSALAYGLGAVFAWTWVRWIGLAAAAMEVFALSMSLHADFTPFSPGANDNASAVGAALELGRRLIKEPLARTEVWLVFTGSEEVGAYGMSAFLDAHAAELGERAVYIALEQVGLGGVNYITSEGILIKRPTHPQALALARQAKASLVEFQAGELDGLAYTDVTVATRRGLIALPINTYPRTERGETSHWHQMSDTLDHIDPQALANAQLFAWQVLQTLDQNRHRVPDKADQDSLLLA